MSEWHSVEDKLPDDIGFYWARRENGAIDLAHFNDWEWARDNKYSEWQVAETVGDAEGLSVEYHHDVTHWAHLAHPSFSEE